MTELGVDDTLRTNSDGIVCRRHSRVLTPTELGVDDTLHTNSDEIVCRRHSTY